MSEDDGLKAMGQVIQIDEVHRNTKWLHCSTRRLNVGVFTRRRPKPDISQPTTPAVGAHRAHGTQLIILPSLHMKVMQHTMKNRSEHKRRSDYDNQPGEDCVRARKDFAGSSLELAEWTHAGEDHGCVHIRVRKRHALEVAITSHANDETAQREHKPNSDRPQHPAKKIAMRNQLLAAMLEVNKAKW
jgi:hypothetical protein